jgi:hypothetical protein
MKALCMIPSPGNFFLKSSRLSILGCQCTTDSRQHRASDLRQRCTTFEVDADCKSTGKRVNVKGFL